MHVFRMLTFIEKLDACSAFSIRIGSQSTLASGADSSRKRLFIFSMNSSCLSCTSMTNLNARGTPLSSLRVEAWATSTSKHTRSHSPAAGVRLTNGIREVSLSSGMENTDLVTNSGFFNLSLLRGNSWKGYASQTRGFFSVAMAQKLVQRSVGNFAWMLILV